LREHAGPWKFQTHELGKLRKKHKRFVVLTAQSLLANLFIFNPNSKSNDQGFLAQLQDANHKRATIYGFNYVGCSASTLFSLPPKPSSSIATRCFMFPFHIEFFLN
jgi:hypothetical protein